MEVLLQQEDPLGGMCNHQLARWMFHTAHPAHRSVEPSYRRPGFQALPAIQLHSPGF